MRKLRMFYRLFAFVALTVAHWLIFELTLLLFRVESKRGFDLRTKIYRGWARSVAKTIGMRVKTRGTPPKPPYFFVINHLSYIDVLLAATQLDGAAFVSKHDLQSWFGLGLIAKRVGTIFIDRKSLQSVSNVTAMIEEKLKAGYGVAMAPESTTTKGESVIPFHGPLLEPAIRLGVPVSYATIRYRTFPPDLPAFESVNWWRKDNPFMRHGAVLLQLNGFEASIDFGEAPMIETNRKTLAKKLHEAVSAKFVPMVNADNVPLDHLEAF
jgi:1-acyl-sn-glycerol-3-phosphate acyltransferase